MSNPAIKEGLSVLGTLAFAIPGPWGVVVSAGLQAIGFMLPGDQKNPIIEAIQKSTADLEDYNSTHNLNVDTAYIDAIKNWLTMVNSTQDIYTNTAQLEQTIRALSTLYEPVTAAQPAISDFKALYSNLDANASKTSAYGIAKTALTGEITLLLSIAQCYNVRLSLTQTLANLYASSNLASERAKVIHTQKNLEAYYETLVAYLETNIYGDTAKINFESTLAKLKEYRISLVTEAESENWIFKSHDIIFSDELTGEVFETVAGNVIFRGTHTTLTGAPNPAYTTAVRIRDDQFHAAAKKKRDNYITSLEVEADAFSSEVMSLITKARSIWNSATPAAAPSSVAPTVNFFDTGRQGAWKCPGKYVSYAFCYLSPNGRSADSPFGPVDKNNSGLYVLCPSSNSVVPQLTFPSDPTGIATSRLVIRRVADDENGGNALEELIAIPNMSEDFYDINPVTESDIAPNALAAPVLAAFSKAWNTQPSGSKWKKPGAARYRYRYTLNGTQSLSWSPWAVTQRSDMQTPQDNQHYISHDGYYGAMLQVPEKHACSFELQRQFKGESSQSIPVTVTKGKLGDQPVIWIEDGTPA